MTIKEAYLKIKKFKRNKEIKTAIDFDDKHYVFCFNEKSEKGIDYSPDWVWVDKNTGEWGVFYPFKDIDKFARALNSREVEISALL